MSDIIESALQICRNDDFSILLSYVQDVEIKDISNPKIKQEQKKVMKKLESIKKKPSKKAEVLSGKLMILMGRDFIHRVKGTEELESNFKSMSDEKKKALCYFIGRRAVFTKKKKNCLILQICLPYYND